MLKSLTGAILIVPLSNLSVLGFDIRGKQTVQSVAFRVRDYIQVQSDATIDEKLYPYCQLEFNIHSEEVIMSNASNNLALKLNPLRPFAERIATVRSPTENLYSYFLSASFVRAFEFVDLASKQQSENAFFLVPALRGITEDIIYLHFLSRFDYEIRQQVLHNMIQLEAEQQLADQNSFFQRFRPFQPVLPSGVIDTDEMRSQLLSFWQDNGWRKLRKSPPRTRDIALKSGSVPLHIVYDFIFRFTSNMVHFNPQVLLRSGWGLTPEEVRVSTRHMGNYYLEASQTYGSYLLCLYFEFFGPFLGLNQDEKDAVGHLREYLLRLSRWPEMITYEEMNIDVPKTEFWPKALIHAMINALMKDGFITGSEEMIALYKSSKSSSAKEVQ